MQVQVTQQEWKLSEIWDRASRELTQVKGRFGDTEKKEVCALGAILFYLSNGTVCNRYEALQQGREIGDYWLMKEYSSLVDLFYCKTGKKIADLNDDEGWTFENFAERARELGL
ncbi:MAG TPA: hypothetical protein VFF30_06560 [Nitrososphaerales archaeon]|nr:hypothetical protein [Nitrososphaerales archaeon]